MKHIFLNLKRFDIPREYRDDTAENGNFGAFTTNRTANAAKAMGCSSVIIGHCEERKDKAGILKEAGVTDEGAVGRLLNQEIKAAIQAGLTVLYCIGETAGEQEQWQEVLKSQLETGLKDVDKEKVVIAYEPIWAIGPGKTPPDEAYITKIGFYIKEMTGGMDVVYGGHGRRPDCPHQVTGRNWILSGGISGDRAHLSGTGLKRLEHN